MNTTLANAGLQNLVGMLKEQRVYRRDVIVPPKLLCYGAGSIFLDEDLGDQVAGLKEMLAQAGVSPSEDEAGTPLISTLKLVATSHAKNQLRTVLGIPAVYWDKLEADHEDLLRYNVNALLARHGKNLMLRTFVGDKPAEGVLRAVLSSSYKSLDNLDVLGTVLETLQGLQDGFRFSVESADLTETHMNIRFYAPDVVADCESILDRFRSPRTGLPDVPGGGIVAGFMLSNSEVGAGAFKITPRLIVGKCKNGIVFKRDALSMIHLGTKKEAGIIEWSEATEQKNMELVMSMAKDAVTKFVSADYLGQAIATVEQLAGHDVEKPLDTIKEVGKTHKFTDEHVEKLMDYFIKGADTSAWGVAQAITAMAYDEEDRNNAVLLEEAAIPFAQDVTRN